MGSSFVYCVVDDVKHHENDIEDRKVSCVYRPCKQIKLAFLGKSTGIFSIGWVIKQLFHGCLAE